MGVFSGPDVSESGLVLAVDGANIKSFKGEVTTNIVPNANVMSGWSPYSSGNDGTFTTEFGTTGYRIINRPSWNGISQNITLPSTGTYTLSAWFRYWGGSADNNGATVYTNGGGIGDTAATLDKSKVGVWQRVTMTRTYSTTSITFFLISYGGTNAVSTWDVTMPQIEAKSYATTFTTGTRGTTVATGGGWADLSGTGNNGELVNGVRESSDNLGSLLFDGVDDRIDCGTFSVPYLTVSTWVYKTSSATNQGICRKETGWAVSQYNGTLQVAPGTSWTFYNTGYTIPLNTWVNIVYTYSGTGAAGSQTVYVNGSIIYSTSAGSGPITANSNAVRIGYDDNNWFWGGKIANTQIYNRALTATEIQQNYNATVSRYIPYIQDGSSADRAALSASALVSLGFTTDGVYWINLPTVGPTQVYCILNPAYDGGGWMMAMKATTGTTFNYSANYWTTANTLNPTENNRNNGDAKFNSMNYFESKDMMAIWPDISNGGSIPSSTLGWTWLQNNFNDGTRITPISFFGITYPTMNTGGSGKFIQDAKTFSGWASGVFSSQVDIRFYGFNYINNPSYGLSMKCRWGFGWNENGEGLYPSSGGGAPGSNDVTGGIGLDTGGGSYSAGDRINCCQDTTGINRSARVEIYVR